MSVFVPTFFSKSAKIRPSLAKFGRCLPSCLPNSFQIGQQLAQVGQHCPNSGTHGCVAIICSASFGSLCSDCHHRLPQGQGREHLNTGARPASCHKPRCGRGWRRGGASISILGPCARGACPGLVPLGRGSSIIPHFRAGSIRSLSEPAPGAPSQRPCISDMPETSPTSFSSLPETSPRSFSRPAAT